jgi:UDP-N-acetylmuramoyl-L-alanyl-D-glutamate--2,6-diaminopimelate ligase
MQRRLSTFLTADLARRAAVLERRGDPSLDPDVAGIAYDSRAIRNGWLYFALTGLHVDGHSFVPQAVAAGAAVVVHEKPLDSYDPHVVYIRVQDSRFAMSPFADAF